MTKLKLGPLADDTPVKLAVELPASLHRDLVLYGELLGRIGPGGTGAAVPPQKLVVPMLERFLASDRGFAKAQRNVSAGRQLGD
ncbi:DUF2274 domain-containing protein [Paracoccus denitrificans]|nr:DUF2274 domain-containing protein [Paracoccus denitrificans]MBB4629578.1 hypothetical protein [Paracoccus denitrificans]MCU7430974.1 DUF2274 domain-containing protein [Paracoccus denitrificans]QAR27915.1 DUF2274 domain-containing protein [Paracoccus denitrificans]UPV98118.1 DUF2274 domain-containing protein [Paracoccus denitrificans]WQO35543.1 DUF2274 domain-containing protein [Paracoccus denitrificans]